MNSKNILAVLASTVAGFIVGGLIYGIILEGFMKANMVPLPGVMKNPPVFVAIVFANLAQAILFTWILKSMSVSKFFGGFLKILCVGALIGIMMDLFIYASMDMYKSFLGYFIDVLAFSVTSAVMGGVAALILGSGKKQTAP